MECEGIKELLPNYVNHTADEETVTTIEEHLCICNDCRQFLSDIIDSSAPTPTPKPSPQPFEESPLRTPELTKTSSGIFEYVMLTVGIVILGFIVFLFLNR